MFTRLCQAVSRLRRQKKTGARAPYVALYIYCVPVKAEAAFRQTLEAVIPICITHGMVGSELYGPADLTAKYKSRPICDAMGLASDETTYFELDYFQNAKHCQDVMAALDRDPRIHDLFAALETQIPIHRIVRAEFERWA